MISATRERKMLCAYKVMTKVNKNDTSMFAMTGEGLMDATAMAKVEK